LLSLVSVTSPFSAPDLPFSFALRFPFLSYSPLIVYRTVAPHQKAVDNLFNLSHLLADAYRFASRGLTSWILSYVSIFPHFLFPRVQDFRPTSLPPPQPQSSPLSKGLFPSTSQLRLFFSNRLGCHSSFLCLKPSPPFFISPPFSLWAFSRHFRFRNRNFSFVRCTPHNRPMLAVTNSISPNTDDWNYSFSGGGPFLPPPTCRPLTHRRLGVFPFSRTPQTS